MGMPCLQGTQRVRANDNMWCCVIKENVVSLKTRDLINPGTGVGHGEDDPAGIAI